MDPKNFQGFWVTGPRAGLIKAQLWETKTLNLSRNIVFRCKFWVNISCFPPCVFQLVAQQKHLLQVEETCCKKWSIHVGLLWATNFGFVSCFSSNSQLVHTKHINQSVHCISSTHNKCFCFCCGTSWSCEVKNEKRWTKTCNETILRNKLRAFVSRILPP